MKTFKIITLIFFLFISLSAKEQIESVDDNFILKLSVVFVMVILVVIFFLVRQNRLKNRIEILNHTLEEKVNLATLDLRRAQKLSKIGSWRYEIDKDILNWSDETYSIFQIDKIKTPVKSLDDFTSKLDTVYIEVIADSYGEHLADGTPYDITHKLVLEDGTVKWIREKCETMCDKDGKPFVSNGTVQDVTEQILMEEDIKAKDKQMFYQSRLAQMGEMISMIAHQWRQPLGAIASTTIDMKMKIELGQYNLEEKEGRESCQSYFMKNLDDIESLTQNLTTTINDFRDFYKPNKSLKTVSINDPIQKSLNIVGGSLITSNILLLEYYNSSKKIELFDSEIMQVILNILNNAQDNFKIKDISEAKIWIRTEDINNGINLSICDNGGGIDEEIIEKIFNPYFSTKHDKNGTGLGLYMSKMIIEEHHNGSLSVVNKDDGVCFSIELKGEIHA